MGFNTGWSFSDFDEWVREKIPDDFKGTFTYYLIDKLFRAVHHYMIGILIMLFYCPPSGLASLSAFAFGLGLFLEEADVFLSDLNKIKNSIRKLKKAGGLDG